MTESNDRAIVFGAGKAGEFFIKSNTQHQILAVVDNDQSKHGSTFLGYPVISPSQIASFSYDYIVIASQWADQISHQLHTLGVAAERIVIPKKIDVKSAHPFNHPETKALGHEIIRAVHRLMLTHNVDLFLDSGTLLGIVRDGDLIQWDDDIDFAVNSEQFPAAIEAMKQFGAVAPAADKVSWSLELLSMLDEDVSILINFENKPGVNLLPFETAIQMRRIVDDKSELVSSAGLFFAPARFFSGYQEIEFLGMQLKAPNDYQGFLQFMYGDWKSPKKEMKITDYDNRRVDTKIDPRAIAIKKRAL